MKNKFSRENMLNLALKKIVKIIGTSAITHSNISFVNQDNIFALSTLKKETPFIQIDTEAIDNTIELWSCVQKEGISLLDGSEDNGLEKGGLNEASIVWLILHEIQHFELGHFELLGRDQISEAGGVQEFGLISRPDSAQPRITDIDYLKLERCLELQADHAATKLFLEPYSTDEWEELRVRIACIVAVMVLIDVEDSKNNFEHSSHPKAATRIFQLMGHVSEMPLVPAQLKAKEQNTTIHPDDIPSEKEQQAFSKQVAIPAFYDAIALAQAAGAEHIIEELGDLPAFFQDVLLAKTNSDGDPSQFKTEGAKEWAELIVINEQLNEVTA